MFGTNYLSLHSTSILNYLTFMLRNYYDKLSIDNYTRRKNDIDVHA